MKRKLIFIVAAFIMSTSVISASGKKPAAIYAYPAGRESIIENGNTLTNLQIENLVNRVNAISEMDRSKLSSSEKKQLRSELRNIKNQLHQNRGVYIYLSGTAILIIILLIILL